MNILEACEDPALFAPWFKNPDTYEAWFAFLAALFGLPMTPAQLDIYRRHTGRSEPPTAPSREGWLIVGRRGGKSFVMALTAVFLACFHNYRQFLAPGERATVMVLAADRKQARVVLRFVEALLKDIPLLARMVERSTAESFELTNRTTIEVGTASFRSTRGYTYAAVICDELAIWRYEEDASANPDVEILNAVRGGMLTIPTSLLLCASSPYARRGALWGAYQNYFGKDHTPLVWKATTREMNPTVPQAEIDAALAQDYAKFSAEYLAEFRTDVETFIPREAVIAVTDSGIRERPPQRNYSYSAFVDPSGGSSDSFTLAISHASENGTAVLDAIRERRPPFSPDAVVKEFAHLLRRYGISSVRGDRYGGEWPREVFKRHGISYITASKPKSEIYLDLLPAIMGREVSLLDDERMVRQLCNLERSTSRAGRDAVDHPSGHGQHDDLINAAAGALVFAKKWPTHQTITTTVIGMY